jgi:hypothetical protein
MFYSILSASLLGALRGRLRLGLIRWNCALWTYQKIQDIARALERSGKKTPSVIWGQFGTHSEIWPSWLDSEKMGKIGGKVSKFPGILRSLGRQYMRVEKN